ncbi:MAG: hypothetical protein R2792_14025 [Saprospiraceae bacterium]
MRILLVISSIGMLTTFFSCKKDSVDSLFLEYFQVNDQKVSNFESVSAAPTDQVKISFAVDANRLHVGDETLAECTLSYSIDNEQGEVVIQLDSSDPHTFLGGYYLQLDNLVKNSQPYVCSGGETLTVDLFVKTNSGDSLSYSVTIDVTP